MRNENVKTIGILCMILSAIALVALLVTLNGSGAAQPWAIAKVNQRHFANGQPNCRQASFALARKFVEAGYRPVYLATYQNLKTGKTHMVVLYNGRVYESNGCMFQGSKPFQVYYNNHRYVYRRRYVRR